MTFKFTMHMEWVSLVLSTNGSNGGLELKPHLNVMEIYANGMSLKYLF